MLGLIYAHGTAGGAMAWGLRALSGQSDPCDRLWGSDGSIELLLPGRWWRPGGGEGDPQVVDDLVDDRVVGDEGNDLHLGAAGRTDEGISLVDLPNKFSPTG